MKTLSLSLILLITLFFPFYAQAEKLSEKALHDMHLMMQFMDHGLCVALEGANMQMLGQTGMSEKLDKDAIVHGTIMVKDGKSMIKEMLEGKAMRDLYKEGSFDKTLMDNLHKLGEKMLEVIDLVEKIHEGAFAQASGKQ